MTTSFYGCSALTQSLVWNMYKLINSLCSTKIYSTGNDKEKKALAIFVGGGDCDVREARKDEARGRSSLKGRERAIVSQTNIREPFQRQRWGKVSETGCSPYGLSRAHRYHPELELTAMMMLPPPPLSDLGGIQWYVA